MDSIPGIRNLRLILRVGATVFGLSAIALMLFPRFFNELLGLAATAELDWAMRLIGITLVALTGNMVVISFYGSEMAVRAAGWVMMVSAFGLGAITLMIPTSYNWFNISYAIVGLGFSIAYLSQVARSIKVS